MSNKEDCCSNCHQSWNQDEFPDGDVQAWAVFENNNIFTYVIWQFKLLSDKTFVKNDVLCNKCLKTMKYEEYLGVTCSNCKKQYQSYFSDCMGYGCSADVHQDHIDCGYGSKYDDDQIKFIQEPPAWPTTNPTTGRPVICDECITDLIQRGICQAPKTDDYDGSHSVSLNVPYPPTTND